MGISFPITEDQIQDVVQAIVSFKPTPKANKPKTPTTKPHSKSSEMREFLEAHNIPATNTAIQKYLARMKLHNCTMEEALDDSSFRYTKPKKTKVAMPTTEPEKWFGVEYFRFDPTLVFKDEVLELVAWMKDNGFRYRYKHQLYRVAALNILLKYQYIDNEQYWGMYDRMFSKNLLTSIEEIKNDNGKPEYRRNRNVFRIGRTCEDI